jgi:hypothetical protein
MAVELRVVAALDLEGRPIQFTWEAGHELTLLVVEHEGTEGLTPCLFLGGCHGCRVRCLLGHYWLSHGGCGRLERLRDSSFLRGEGFLRVVLVDDSDLLL